MCLVKGNENSGKVALRDVGLSAESPSPSQLRKHHRMLRHLPESLPCSSRLLEIVIKLELSTASRIPAWM